jgi:hypothetical protein
MGLIVLAGCGGGSSSIITSSGSPAVTLSPSTLTFSGQAPGTSSAAQSVTVTNSGSAALTFSGITVSGGFSQSNNCGTGIPAGGACTVSVIFTPTAAGTLTGTLTIADNASNSPQTVSLTGTAAIATLKVSPTSLTFGSQGVGTSSAPQSVTAINTSTVAFAIPQPVVSGDFSVTGSACDNVIPGTECIFNVIFTPTAVGTRTGTLTFTGNFNNSPQTVSLTGTGTSSSVSLSTNTLTFAGLMVGSSSAAQPVTLTNTGNVVLAISSIAVTASTSDFSQSNNCGVSLAVAGSCTINVTFTPTTGGTRTGTLTITDSAGTQTLTLNGTGLTNTAQVTVSFGPNGNTGSSSINHYNGIYTTITLCEPGSTTNCVNIPNVLVDTGSVGLRVLSNQLGSVTLPQVNDPSTGNPIYECVQYGDLSYTWGPVQWATVQIGGEAASQVPGASGGTPNSGIPIQVISAGATPPSEVGVVGSDEGYDNPCLVNPATGAFPSGGVNDDSVANLGSNGILGVGNYQQDCGADCTSITNTSGQYLIWDASTSNYYIQAVSLLDQVWNPVSAFSSTDTNGVVIQLPSIPTAGQATATGTLTFGIGTESNNAIPNTATVYELDDNGNFASTVFNGVTYQSGGYLDSGSNALFVSDYATITSVTGVSTVDCADNEYYCPSSPLTLNITNYGYNGTSGEVNLSIYNADSLFSANPTFAAFNDIGSDSGTDPSTDYFDYGVPFFFGQTIFVGIAGTSSTYPNGYWAF